MNEKCMRWLLAVMMGVVLPSFMFSVAEKLFARRLPDDIPWESTAANHAEDTKPPEKTKKTIPVLAEDGKLAVIDMDTYLIGVVLGEMPADFELEALKAQAVVARTYACKRNTTGQKHPSGAVCTEASCCQSYCEIEEYLSQGGTQDSINKITDAVKSTTDQVLTYNGELIEATYFSCSGGKTEDAQAVWGTAIPYLQSVDSPGEENALYYQDSVKFSAKDFAAMLGFTPKGVPNTWFGNITYTKGGGVDTINICGVVYKGTTLRQKLGLRSTVFTVMPAGDAVHILTRGFGHRVGMSQYGAEAMAVSGSDYTQILVHYYPGTNLVTYLQN